jgi:speckle-type POZ protein
MSTPMRTRRRSICTPVTEQGSHSFEISGYSLHKGMAKRDHISSGVFSVGGHDWAIRFIPNGGCPDPGDGGGPTRPPFISIFLLLLSKGGKVRASCALSLVDHTTGLPSPTAARRTPEPLEFSYGGPSMYLPHTGFMPRAELEDSPFLRDDRLTIHCDVTVIKRPLVLTNMFANEIPAPPPNIGEHLGRLLETGVGADVTSAGDGETVAAHKLVLAARSPVFMAEFFGPMEEATAARVAIEDMRSDTFRALLHFIYTDDVRADADSELIQHLLVAADRYGVDRLKTVCESVLCDGLDVWNVDNCPRLKNCCFEVVNRSDAAKAVKETRAYKDLKRKWPDILAEAFEFKTSRLRKK